MRYKNEKMKLNIGCGKIYKKYFVNIDVFDKTIADKIMSADDLKFSSNSIERIEASQLIEHFGLFKSIYVLSEWFRVLKPNGTLIIETPDIEESFKKFLYGNLEARKNSITWIYGLETPGMTHKFSYPEDLLGLTLKKIGFNNIKKTFFEEEKDHPTLRIECKKTIYYKPYQVIACFRKQLLVKKIVDLDDYNLSYDQEELIDYLIKKINQFYKNKNYNKIDEIVIEGSVKSVIIVINFLKECIKQKILDKNKIKKHLEILEFLNDIKFQTILYCLIKKSPGEPGTQNKVIQTIYNIGKQSVKKLLINESKKNNIRTSIEKLSKECKEEKIIFFSEKLLEKKSSELSYNGTKDFILGNLDKALAKINESIKIDRNRILYYWNRARILTLKKDLKKANKDYENAIKLIRISDHKDKEKILKLLEKEKYSFSKKIHGKPIIKIEDVLN